jgi:poly(3-hydroxybutyrate) depolymerase
VQHQWLGDPEAPPSSVLDDRIFVNDLLDHLTATFCVDENRIHAAGVSNGGGLVGLLACSPVLNRRIASFATVAGAFYTDESLTEPLFGKGCNPDLTTREKIPMKSFHGLKDTVIAYNGNNNPAPNTIPVYEWVKTWVAKEKCKDIRGPRVVIFNAAISMFGWYCFGDSSSDGGVKDVVAHHRIGDFGHGWPSTVPLEGGWTGTTAINATFLIMEFFDEWPLDASY